MRRTNDAAPEGAGEGDGLPQEAFVEINAATLQEFPIFFLEGSFSMVLFLAGDVAAHGLAVRGADGEGSITFLPRKGTVTDLIMHPF